MKAVILSAGYGSRLLPLTTEIPKCLVKVQDREILLHQLDALYGAGVREAVVVVGYRHRQVEDFLRRDLPLKVSTVFNPFWSVANSIGSVWAVRDWLHAPFCLLNGDTVFDPAVLNDALDRAPSGIGLLVEPATDSSLDDMRVAVEEGRITAVSKDLPAERATHRSLGVVVSTDRDGSYLRALATVIGADGGQAAYHHAVVAELAETVGVAAISRRIGQWQEIDRPEDISAWDRAHRADPHAP